ncbi:hypothetical protein DH2020_036213 [Rehmannia glutinosa]|uniref:ALOG domain-containing protein n=1 Tax=Rehmannia glutinosa TaxID=99300 RepID=A0ABR0V580_REHGL
MTGGGSTIASPTSAASSSSSAPQPQLQLSRYENQKRRDWNTFGQYLRNHRPRCRCPAAAGPTSSSSSDTSTSSGRLSLRGKRGKPESNPFGARAVRLYLREVRDSQSKARGISYEKKKRKRPPPPPPAALSRPADGSYE